MLLTCLSYVENTGCCCSALLLPDNKATNKNIIINPSIEDLELMQRSEMLNFTINNLFLFALSKGGSYKFTKDLVSFLSLGNPFSSRTYHKNEKNIDVSIAQLAEEIVKENRQNNMTFLPPLKEHNRRSLYVPLIWVGNSKQVAISINPLPETVSQLVQAAKK